MRAIFAWNFTQLLNNKMCTLRPTLVEIHIWENDKIMLFQPWQTPLLKARASWTRTGPLRRRVAPTSPDLNSRLDYHVWGAMLEKYNKLQLRRLMSWKSPYRWEEPPRKKYKCEFHQALDCLYCGCQWWLLRVVVTPNLYPVSSSHKQTGWF